MKLDLDKLVELAEQEFGPVDEEIMQILSTIKQFRVQYILDIETGTLYLNCLLYTSCPCFTHSLFTATL